MATTRIISRSSNVGREFLDFEQYINAIVGVVTGSYPKYSIGLCGRRGAGKSHLMDATYRRLLQYAGIIPVWFDVWRSGAEGESLATKFVRTLAIVLEEQRSYVEDKESLQFLRRFFHKTNGIFESHQHSVNSDFIRDNTLKSNDGMTSDVLSYSRVVADFENALNSAREKSNFIIVTFVDNLDRCTPRKVVEFLEMQRIFSIEGLVFIISFNFDTIMDSIQRAYNKDSIFASDQILKEIVEILITIPDPKATDIHSMVSKLANSLDVKYKSIIIENTDLIASFLGPSTIDIARFINTFIVSNEIFSVNDALKPEELFIIRLLKYRWNELYFDFGTSIDLRNLFEKLLEKPESDRIKDLENLGRKNLLKKSEQKLLKYKSDSDLWNFLYRTKILNLHDWNSYKQAVELVS